MCAETSVYVRTLDGASAWQERWLSENVDWGTRRAPTRCALGAVRYLALPYITTVLGSLLELVLVLVRQSRVWKCNHSHDTTTARTPPRSHQSGVVQPWRLHLVWRNPHSHIDTTNTGTTCRSSDARARAYIRDFVMK